MSSFNHPPDGFPWIEKSIEGRLDYSIDWKDWLNAGEEISSVTWTIPSPLMKASESFTTIRATAWIEGGQSGSNHIVSAMVTTNQGRRDTRSFVLRVRKR